MDLHVRWLRRFLVGRVLTRVALEALLAGGAAAVTGLLLAVDPLLATALGLVTLQMFAVMRLAAAVLFNPVNHRYLTRWEDQAGRLQPIDGARAARSPADRARDAELARIALHHLVRLAVPGAEAEPGAGLDVYVSPSRLVVAAVGDDTRLLVLSKLTDGRLLITAAETVPPHRRLLLNPTGETTSAGILLHHVERLDALRPAGIEAVPTGYDTVVQQLGIEWSSWNELGPFLGPFLAVDPRPQPHLLQFRPKPELLAGLNRRTQPEPIVRHRFPAPSPGGEPSPPGPVVTVEVPRPRSAQPA